MKKWTPEAEDFILSLGVEIEEDDAPDDVEARVQRFASYAEAAASSAESAAAYLESERCNTARRKKCAANRAQNEAERAAYWQERILGAIGNAKYKELPGVIFRRCKELTTDLTRAKKRAEEGAGWVVKWSREGLTAEQGRALANYDHGIDLRRRLNIEHNYPVSAYDVFVREPWKSTFTAAQVAEAVIAGHQARIAYQARWIAHLEDRLTYENALLESQGLSFEGMKPARRKAVQPKGPAKNKAGETVELLGAINKAYWGDRPADSDADWKVVVKVNRTTVHYLSVQHYSNAPEEVFEYKTPSYGCRFIMSAADVKAKRPDLLALVQKWKNKASAAA